MNPQKSTEKQKISPESPYFGEMAVEKYVENVEYISLFHNRVRGIKYTNQNQQKVLRF